MKIDTFKQVGIMTWYSYENYGSVLQAVALNRVIGHMGYKVFDIAYDPLLGRGTHEVPHWSIPRKCANKAKLYAGYSPIVTDARSRLFKDFVCRNIELSEDVKSKDELSNLATRYDAYVCGSDQIWSPRCFDSSYYLDFVDDTFRMVAYAPSFGCDDVEPFAASGEIGGLLRRFKHIGVREAAAVDIIEKYTDIKPPVVLDPTLLLDADTWATYSSPVDEEGSYCLVYFLGSDSCNWRAARAIAKKNGLRIVAVPVFERDRRRGFSASYPIGPAEFLWLLSHATLVCTDSFHGMVFSTIFERPFIAFERFDPRSSESQNTRVYSFLDMIGAGERLLARSALSSWREHADLLFDFSETSKRITKKKAVSLEYLGDALECAASGREGEA